MKNGESLLFAGLAAAIVCVIAGATLPGLGQTEANGAERGDVRSRHPEPWAAPAFSRVFVSDSRSTAS
jgi:hypothetical protein